MPLIALLGLIHFRVTLTRAILGRGRCGNQGGIDDTAFAHEQTLLRQVQIDRLKDRFGQMLCLEQAPKLQQRGGVRCRLPTQINPDKTPNGLATVDGVFHPFILQAKALLHDVHAQHTFQTNRRSATLVALGVMRFEFRHQRAPRCHCIYLRKEAITSGDLLLRCVFEFGETSLHEQSRYQWA